MATISDVAKRANVSIATVSRVLNNASVVSEKTVKKVRQAMDELSYTPNPAGQMLKRKGSKTIFLYSSVSPPSAVLQMAFERRAAEIGLDVAVLPNIDVKTFSWTSFNPYGIILLNADRISDAALCNLADQVPLVTLLDRNDHIPPAALAGVILDHHTELYYRMAKYLLSLGVRSLAYPVVYDATSDKIASYSADREEGIRLAAEEAGLSSGNLQPIPIHDLPKASIQDGGLTFGRMIAEKYIKSGCAADAILCNTDRGAIGCIRGLADHGLRVPEDLLVSGFDGDYLSQFYIPSVTSFDKPFDTLALSAINMLVARNTGEPCADIPQTPCTLIPRESTCAGRFHK